LLHDLREADSERFAKSVCEPTRHETIGVASDLASLMKQSTLVVFATTAGSPYVESPDWFSHCPLILHVSLRDLSPEVVLAQQNIVDDVDHVMNADTSVHLAEQLSGGRDFVSGTLVDVIERRVELAEDRSVVFSPFGMGILDLAVAKWVHGEARESGEALEIGDFFYELER